MHPFVHLAELIGLDFEEPPHAFDLAREVLVIGCNPGLGFTDQEANGFGSGAEFLRFLDPIQEGFVPFRKHDMHDRFA